MVPAAGCVLVASPLLRDAHFAKSVVMLIEHSDRGSMGLILNRPLDLTLGDVWPEVPPALAEVRIAAEGGPVAKNGGLILHACPDVSGAHELMPGLAAGGETSALIARFADGPGPLGPRLFLGHSGWGSGQLQREIEQGSWLLRPGRHDWALRNHHRDELWQRLSEGPDPRHAPSLN